MYNQINAIDLNSLLLFHELGNSDSLRQAALRLDIPVATVSRKLRELERDFGAVLFKRGPHKLKLTEVGSALYEHSVRIVAEVAQARRAVAEMQSEVQGTLRICLPFGFGTDWISRAVAKFAIAYPLVELFIQATHRSVDVAVERIDVAISVGPVRNETLPAVRLSELRRGVYASKAYCEAHGTPQKPADLLKFDCIPLESQKAAGLWKFRNGSRAMQAPARITVSDVGTAYRMVVAGMGFAILPHLICQDGLKQGLLCRVLPDWRIPALPVTATFLERRHLPLRVRTFLDFIRREVKTLQRTS